jgi:hypothetical protein
MKSGGQIDGLMSSQSPVVWWYDEVVGMCVEEPREEFFSVWSVLKLHTEYQWDKLVSSESAVAVGCEHLCRKISIVRGHYQATTS